MAAIALFAVDPVGTGGIWLRALPGPVRDRLLQSLAGLLPGPMRRVPLQISDDRLLGGLDLAATLRAGRPVAQSGLLAEADGGVLLLAMAERLQTGLSARLCAVLDQGEVALERDGLTRRSQARLGMVALDEGMEADERPPAGLLDRLAFHIDLADIRLGDMQGDTPDAGAIATAGERLAGVEADEDIVRALCATAMALGIASVRAPQLALRVARAAAALDGRDSVTMDDAALAGRLVFARRATTVPAQPQEEDASEAEPEPQPDSPPAADAADPETGPEDEQEEITPQGPLADIVLQAPWRPCRPTCWPGSGCRGGSGACADRRPRRAA